MTTKIEAHEKAVAAICTQCRRFGIAISIMPRIGCGFDLLANLVAKIEVKVATKLQLRPKDDFQVWKFNIHRHGKIHIEKIDFYIFRIPPMTALGFKTGITLIIPGSEINSKVISISARSLIWKWSKWINRWDLIKNFSVIKN